MMSSLALAEIINFKISGIKPDLQLDLDHQNRRISIVGHRDSYQSSFSLPNLNNELSPEVCERYTRNIVESKKPFKVPNLNEAVYAVELNQLSVTLQ